MPLVSVIVPHFNRQDLMIPTLEALRAQTLNDWELIVVDDASEQDPTRLVHSVIPTARIIRQPHNRGPAAARNVGVDAARGRFVAFLDSDDHWEPAKLERQMATVLSQPDPEQVFSVVRSRVLDTYGRERVRPSRSVALNEHFSEFLYVSGQFAQSSSMLVSRDAARKVRFQEQLRQYEDHLFFIECGNFGLRYLLVDEVLVVWRNDDRADRLGRSDSLKNGRHFLRLAQSALTERAKLAFETRFLGPEMLRQSPIRAVITATHALALGAIRPRDLALLLAKVLISRRAYERVKSRFR